MLKKEMEENDKKCYAIVCGGDGTVMWVVSEMVKCGIEVAKVPIGIVPLGTGNDFSRELGWGFESIDLVENSFKKLKKMIKKWVNANEDYFDVWDVEAEIFEVR
jgi:diacylglycerol kinase (ATP)